MEILLEIFAMYLLAKVMLKLMGSLGNKIDTTIDAILGKKQNKIEE